MDNETVLATLEKLRVQQEETNYLLRQLLVPVVFISSCCTAVVDQLQQLTASCSVATHLLQDILGALRSLQRYTAAIASIVLSAAAAAAQEGLLAAHAAHATRGMHLAAAACLVASTAIALPYNWRACGARHAVAAAVATGPWCRPSWWHGLLRGAELTGAGRGGGCEASGKAADGRVGGGSGSFKGWLLPFGGSGTLESKSHCQRMHSSACGDGGGGWGWGWGWSQLAAVVQGGGGGSGSGSSGSSGSVGPSSSSHAAATGGRAVARAWAWSGSARGLKTGSRVADWLGFGSGSGSPGPSVLLCRAAVTGWGLLGAVLLTLWMAAGLLWDRRRSYNAAPELKVRHTDSRTPGRTSVITGEAATTIAVVASSAMSAATATAGAAPHAAECAAPAAPPLRNSPYDMTLAASDMTRLSYAMWGRSARLVLLHGPALMMSLAVMGGSPATWLLLQLTWHAVLPYAVAAHMRALGPMSVLSGGGGGSDGGGGDGFGREAAASAPSCGSSAAGLQQEPPQGPREQQRQQLQQQLQPRWRLSVLVKPWLRPLRALLWMYLAPLLVGALPVLPRQWLLLRLSPSDPTVVVVVLIMVIASAAAIFAAGHGSGLLWLGAAVTGAYGGRAAVAASPPPPPPLQTTKGSLADAAQQQGRRADDFQCTRARPVAAVTAPAGQLTGAATVTNEVPYNAAKRILAAALAAEEQEKAGRRPVGQRRQATLPAQTQSPRAGGGTGTGRGRDNGDGVPRGVASPTAVPV